MNDQADQHADLGPPPSTSNPKSDKATVLHIYNVETLYNHVVNSYIEWQTAVVEATIRTNCANSSKDALVQQERCVWKLTCLLFMADSHRSGLGTKRCSCAVCGFARALRSYLAHHWTTKEGDFALRGSAWNNSMVAASLRGPSADPDNRLRTSGLSLFLYRGSVQSALKKAIDKLDRNEEPLDVVPVISSYMTCVAKSHRGWREQNPIPEIDNKKAQGHGYERNLLIGISNEIRNTTGSSLGRIQLYGNPQAKQ